MMTVEVVITVTTKRYLVQIFGNSAESKWVPLWWSTVSHTTDALFILILKGIGMVSRFITKKRMMMLPLSRTRKGTEKGVAAKTDYISRGQ